MTAVVLTFARHAQGGRVHWTRISADVYYGHAAAEPAETLATDRRCARTSARRSRASIRPMPATRRSRRSSPRCAGTRATPVPARIADGPVLKIGMHDNRVPLLRERLGATGDPRDTTYDKDVAEAVKKFQSRAQAQGHRHADRRDHRRDQRAAPSSARDADIILANMERWRWLPRELGNSRTPTWF